MIEFNLTLRYSNSDGPSLLLRIRSRRRLRLIHTRPWLQCRRAIGNRFLARPRRSERS